MLLTDILNLGLLHRSGRHVGSSGGYTSQHPLQLLPMGASSCVQQLNTLEFAKQCTVPAILAHAKEDDFIGVKHHDELTRVYKGARLCVEARVCACGHGMARGGARAA